MSSNFDIEASCARPERVRLEDLALIGNCQFSALIDRFGAISWCCLPRFDAEPVFAKLLDADDGGAFSISPADGSPGVQRYMENTNVLETRFESTTGDGSFRVIDFAPRFNLFDRSFRPTKIVRIIEPLHGTPRIRVSCEPRLGWSKKRPRKEMGSHHVSFIGYDQELRLTTDLPLSYLEGQPFALSSKRHLVLAWGSPVEEPLEPLCARFLRATVDYWRRWVKQCNVPPYFQKEVIRSALALKLHCFEDTGAIVAAMTTSIPESPGSGRTWDYRYCWLRDAYYALDALRRLGQFEEREAFLSYLLNVASSAPDLDLRPLYRIDGRSDLDEHELADWPGYLCEKPVRIGNAAAAHRQNDIFGEMVLALAPMFLDERFRHEQNKVAFELAQRLANKAISMAGVPDAGIWEYRTEWRPQTFSSLMCWAAADRMGTVAERHEHPSASTFRDAADRIRAEILEKAWSQSLGSLTATYGGEDLDAALLQAAVLRFLPGRDPRLSGTVEAIERTLGMRAATGVNAVGGIPSGEGMPGATPGYPPKPPAHGQGTGQGSVDWLRRYRIDDGFGEPTVAFVICTFWFIEALVQVGRVADARTLMGQICDSLHPLGLLGEDWDPVAQRMWGNFPQAYSHVGLIHSAFAASPGWSEVV